MPGVVGESNVTDADHEESLRLLPERLAQHDGRYRVHRLTSVEAARSFENGSLDFVYLDATHSYEAVREDLRAWYAKVRSGGLFGGHAFVDGDRREAQFGVRRAVLRFERENGLRAAVTTEGDWPSWYFFKP